MALSVSRLFVRKLRRRRTGRTYQDPFFADPAIVEHDHRRMKRRA